MTKSRKIDLWDSGGFLEYYSTYPDNEAIPDYYNYFTYRALLQEVEDKATREDNPKYEECCECGTCFTEGEDKYIYTPLTNQELKDRKAYLKKYKKEHEKPRTIRWRRVTPVTRPEEIKE